MPLEWLSQISLLVNIWQWNILWVLIVHVMYLEHKQEPYHPQTACSGVEFGLHHVKNRGTISRVAMGHSPSILVDFPVPIMLLLQNSQALQMQH